MLLLGTDGATRQSHNKHGLDGNEAARFPKALRHCLKAIGFIWKLRLWSLDAAAACKHFAAIKQEEEHT